MIEVKNLTKKYNNTVAVDNISFKINEGEVVGFLGPNGAGKTTTMNMITGYIEPTSGKIFVNGYDIDSKPKMAKKQFGYLPESVPLYNELTVTEFISFMADLKLVPKKEKKAEISRVINEAGLEGVKRVLIKNLSRGYILDEPTVGLDPKQVSEIRSLIKDLGKSHTVLISSHILSEISQMCSKIMIIQKGKIIAIDTPDNLEKNTSETTLVEVTVEGKEFNSNAIKRAIPSISNIELLSYSEENNESIYVISCKNNQDIRKELMKVCSNENIMILEIHKKEQSLEEAFLKITEEEGNK